jgi:hypothetical protein
MHARPVEFKSLSKTIDLFHSRPTTAFSNEVRTRQDLKLDPSIPSHAFFLASYMSFKVDTDFCRDGNFQHFSSTISLPLGMSHPPRMSVLRKLPKQFRNLFIGQTASLQVSSVQNSALAFRQNGGLDLDDFLPAEVHTLLNSFIYSSAFKNPTIPLISQFISYIQGSLLDLDFQLLEYRSPVYGKSPFKLQPPRKANRRCSKIQRIHSMKSGTLFKSEFTLTKSI